MDREQAARRNHNSGYSCSGAVYAAFDDVVSGMAPIPRSKGGMCGAVLAAQKALKQRGIESEDFDRQFLERFGSLKCAELRRSRVPCNDLVGFAARMAGEKIDG